MTKPKVKQIPQCPNVKILKATPIAFDDPDIAAFMDEQDIKHGQAATTDVFPFVKVGAFPGCCGIAVLYGMNSIHRHHNNTLGHSKYLSKGCFVNDPKQQTLTVFGIARAIENWEHHKQLKNFGPMLLCAINDQQMDSGLHIILEEYFGFTPVVKDFKNKGAKEARIRLYSLMV